MAKLVRLVWLAENADNQATQVSACKEILDRGYGKSTQAVQNLEPEGDTEKEISNLELARWVGHLLTKGEREQKKVCPGLRLAISTQTTILRSNCVSDVTYPGIDDQTCNVTIIHIFDPLWVIQLTMTYSEKRLKEDLRVGSASLKAGATVKLRVRGNLMFVIFDGRIIESGNLKT